MSRPDRVFLLDGTALAYRAHFAFIRNPLFDARGRNTSAIYGFVSTLIKLLREEGPDRIAVAFDTSHPTFRHERYEPYKATRDKMPPEIKDQIPLIRETVEKMGIPYVELPGYEADDIIGTLARQATERGLETFLVTGDKDLMQLVDDNVQIYNILKPGQDLHVVDAAGVEEEWGVPPERIVDLLGLMGDSSDNVPGVPGVGKKTAMLLLKEHGTLEATLAAAEGMKPSKRRENLIEFADQARLSKELVTIDTEVPIDVDIDGLTIGERDDVGLGTLFGELAFHGFQKELDLDLGSAEHEYRIVTDAESFEELIAELDEADRIAIDTETTDIDARRADLVGMSFSTVGQEGWYLPFNADPAVLLGEPGDESTPASRLLDALRPILTDPTRKLIAQNAKYDLVVLWRAGLQIENVWFDTMIASFCLEPGTRAHNIDALALRHLGIRKIPTSEIIGSGDDEVTMADVPIEKVGEYACEDADTAYRLHELFEPRLEADELSDLFHHAEMPLVPVLAAMEYEGVRIDLERFGELSDTFATRIAELESEIHEVAGREFNINSPQQLGIVLFDELKVHLDDRTRLKKPRKTKIGYSTDQKTLDQISDHPITQKILEYRSLVKLKGTYVDTLPLLVHPETGRLHTSYGQIGAATGRLSSSDPNLQNIPVRTAEGREIRKAFVPRDAGWKLLSADYSQIELRILAHLSNDPTLIDAFLSGEDIHARTAALVFDVPRDAVDRALRSRAKAINFGIIYGMGPQRLAGDTNITMAEAKQFIANYFEKYPGVRDFQDACRKQAREDGYVITLLGRRRPIPDIHSSDRRLQVQAENVAINTPVQGSAADLIKKAMVAIANRIDAEDLEGRMILTVHDELVFDVPEAEVETMTALVREEMESALELKVPIVVDVGVGDDWLEAH